MAMMDREEEFLSNFFNSVSHLSFDKAKECLERGKEDSHLQSPAWNTITCALVQFAAAEKSYVELGFFARQKTLFRIKDNSLRSVYEHLRAVEMKRVDCAAKDTGNRTIAAVSLQLQDFMKARIELIEFYENMQGVGSSKPVKFSELLGSLEHIVEKHALACPHLSLTWLKAALSLECEVLLHLVRAGAELAEWRFMSSLMLLHGAHTRLVAWETSLGARSSESWRLGSFLTSQRLPVLHQWLVKMKCGLSAKFALLFYNTLLLQTNVSEMKALCSKLAPAVDFSHRLQTFQHKSGAVAVCIVFDMFGLPDHEGPGYKIPKIETTPTRMSPAQTPTSIDSPLLDTRFSQVLNIPQSAQVNFSELTRLIVEKSVELATLDKVVVHFHPRDQCSIYMINFDPRLTLAAIFNTRKSDRDTMTTTFLLETAAQLRGNRLLASLKPGAK